MIQLSHQKGDSVNNFEYNKAIAASQTLTTNEAILAYSIGNYYNWQTGEAAFPTEETLAKDCKMSVRSVRRALSGLVNKDYMSYTRQYNKPNKYIPVLPMRSHSPINEDTSGLLKDKGKDNIKDNNKSSNEDLYEYSKIQLKPEEVITNTSGNNYGRIPVEEKELTRLPGAERWLKKAEEIWS